MFRDWLTFIKAKSLARGTLIMAMLGDSEHARN